MGEPSGSKISDIIFKLELDVKLVSQRPRKHAHILPRRLCNPIYTIHL
jgi:hypothetical protein